jgi:PST family polysaccharide transporter
MLSWRNTNKVTWVDLFFDKFTLKEVRKLYKNIIIRNAFSLYVIKIANFVIPLLCIPYLARVLGPARWGIVILAQAVGGWIGTIVEYGFAYTATRSIARHREQESAVSKVFSDTMYTKFILSGIGMLVALVVGCFLRPLREKPEFLALAVIAGILQGLLPLFYFQGTEQITISARFLLVSRIFVLFSIFLFVRKESHGIRVLAIECIWLLAVAILLIYIVLRKFGLQPFKMRNVINALRESRDMFVFRFAASLYSNLNSIMMGMLLNATAVATFGGGERIFRAATAFIDPVSQAVYPRMSLLVARDMGRARSLLIRVTLALTLIAVILSSVIFIFAVKIVNVILGPSYAVASSVLRVLCLAIPMIAIGTSLGVQWVLPHGLDRSFTRIVIMAGLINISCALFLVPIFGPVGMAWSVVSAETSVVIGLAIIIHSRRLGYS